MSFKPTLSTHLSQRLVLTPQLRQRIEMLQMTKLELSELVSQQMVENPVLEELSPDEVSIPADLANIDFTDTPTLTGLNSTEAGGTTVGLNGDETNYEAATYEPGDNSPLNNYEASNYDAATAYEELNGSEAPNTDNFTERTSDAAGEMNEPEVGQRDAFDEIDFGATFEEYLDPGYRT